MKTRITSILISTVMCFGLAGTTSIAVAGTPTPCPATTITVTTTSDSGPGSLRDAILGANNCPDANIIIFAAGVTNTITLTSGELLITENLTILGPGANLLAVNGNAASRVFHVGPG